MDQQRIGNFLRELRKEKGITQEQLAEELHVSSRTVSRWETGSNMPDISLLVDIAEFFGVGIPELIDGGRKSENMNKEEKEVAEKMTEYAAAEKALLQKRTRIISIVGMVALLAGLLMDTFSPAETASLYRSVTGTCFGLAVGALGTTVLYTTGLLEKVRAKHGKHMRGLAIACFSLVALCLVMSLIASLK